MTKSSAVYIDQLKNHRSDHTQFPANSGIPGGAILVSASQHFAIRTPSTILPILAVTSNDKNHRRLRAVRRDGLSGVCSSICS